MAARQPKPLHPSAECASATSHHLTQTLQALRTAVVHSQIGSFYTEVYQLQIQDGRDRQNLDVAIQATNHLTPTSARTTMGDVCDDALKVMENTFADLPLPLGGPGVEMNEKTLKTFGQTSTLTGVCHS
jgi:hypothetical protein